MSLSPSIDDQHIFMQDGVPADHHSACIECCSEPNSSLTGVPQLLCHSPILSQLGWLHYLAGMQVQCIAVFQQLWGESCIQHC